MPMTNPRRMFMLANPQNQCEQKSTGACFPQVCFPPEIEAAVGDVVTLIALKQVAAAVPDKELQGAMLAELDCSLGKRVEEFTREPLHSWIGAESDVISLVGALAIAAQSYPNDEMRRAVLGFAAGVVQGAARCGTSTPTLHSGSKRSK